MSGQITTFNDEGPGRVLSRSDGARLLKVGSLLQLVGVRGTCNLTNVLVSLCLGCLQASLLTSSHTATANNEVDQGTEPPGNDEQDDPHRLSETRNVVVAEQIGEDREENHQVGDENKRPDEGNEEVHQWPFSKSQN